MYSQIPTSGAGDFTVTRATSATRVNASGYIESAKTNLLLRSEEFDNASWSKNATGINTSIGTSGIQANVAISPDGTQNADRVNFNLQADLDVGLSQSYAAATVGQVYNTSIYFKGEGTNIGKQIKVRIKRLSGGSLVLSDATITLTSDWVRFASSAITLVASNSGVNVIVSSNDATDALIWGAQVEEGSSASEYIPTTTVARTRFAGVTVDGTSAINIPRLDYFASGGVVGCPALLVEPSGSNACLQSENFLTTWSPTNISVTTGTTAAFTAPDGTTNADLLTASASGSARIIQSFSFVSGTTYTYSAFAKAGSGFFGLTLENGGVASGAAVIWNLNTVAIAVSGTAGAGYTLQSQGIEDYGNGWYRCRMTVLLGRTVAGNMRANTSDGTMSSTVIQSASGNTVYIWGAQIETGSVATSYIPTTTAAVTRNADVISVSGAVSGSIGQTVGTIYCEFAFFGTPTSRSGPIYLRQAGLRGLSINFAPSDSPAGIRFSSRNNGGETAINIVSGALQIGTYYKIAIGYDASGTAAGGSQASGVVAYVNGVQTAIGAFRVPDAAGLTEFRMYGANAGSDVEEFNGRIRAAALYTTRLTNAQLAALTT